MRRLEHGTLRTTGFVALLTVVFLETNTTVAAAATGGGTAEVGGLLAPLNVTTSEGAPLNGYELDADGGAVTNFAGQTQVLLLGGLFTLVRLMVGLSCWLIQFAFRFPLITALLHPAQKVADAYNTHVVGALGLKGLLLGWAFVFGLILFARGKVGTGLGEIVLTLLIAAFAASMFIRPDYLLARGGPLDQTRQAALEVAQITTSSYFGASSPSSTANPCALVAGPAQSTCQNSDVQAQQVARPLQDALTNALVVKPYELLEYGRILDPATAADKAAYKIHLKWVKGDYSRYDTSSCNAVPGPAAKQLCLDSLQGSHTFAAFTDDLGKAGDVGKSAADYAQAPSWDRVGAVLLLLIAVAVIALMVISMTMVLLGTQGADAGAAAVGGIAWVWGMLPGPSRMALWRWIGVYIVSVMVGFVVAMAIPMFGIAVDALFTTAGPNLMVERLLLLDAVAIGFLAFHRRLTSATSQFAQRLALRMRYSTIGGTHLPGDTSEVGAALAMNGFAGGGGSPGLLGGPSGAHAALGARHRVLGNLAAMADGNGMPFDPGRLLGEAMAEGRRGFAPVALALRGAHTALIGPKPPEEDESIKLLRAIAKGGTGGDAGPDGGGKPMQVNTKSGEILHDPDSDRPLLGSRMHQRASRLRGYRIASRAARFGYGATLGLPRNLGAGRGKASQFTQDAQTQLNVTANQVRQDAEGWAPVIHATGRASVATGRFVSRTVDHQSQRLATAWQVHDPAQAARTAARDTAAAGAMFASPSTVTDPGPRQETTQSPADTETVNRQQIFDALMRLQRSTWDNPPSWGGEQE
jgi:hypothetical protein